MLPPRGHLPWGAIDARGRSPLRIAAPALAGGLLVALSLPPWGWWPLGWIGLGVLAWRINGLTTKQRILAGVAFALGQFVPGLWWMTEFNFIGGLLVMLLETAFITGGTALSPTPLTLPAALVLAEAVRGRIPFHGLPMAGVALGQVGGPLGPSARLGGALLVLGLTTTLGAAGAEAVRRRWRTAVVAGALAVLVAGLGAIAPDGGRAHRALTVAVVQGGGRRGFRAIETDPRDVFARQVAATRTIDQPVDLVLWPEDVVDVDEPLATSEEAAEVSTLAQARNAPVIAGVVDDAADPDHFRNAAVLWLPDGRLAGRYDKVHRVPFGEYIPGRGLIEHLVDLSVIPRDAVPGHGPGLLAAPTTGPLGVVISYEVYFADRARAAVNAGGRVLLVPTNAASFKTSQVPTTEVAAARLRAIESGRDLAQSAPTGYGAFIDHHGRVLSRTTLGRRQVLLGLLHTRTGRTIYTRTGDWPVILLAAAAVAISRLSPWTRRRPSRTSPSP